MSNNLISDGPVPDRQGGTGFQPSDPPAPWTTAPAVIDHHVHLGLVDWRALAGSPLGEVHDLGWGPDEIDRIAMELAPDLQVVSCGPFHTAPGGYPTGRPWAPPSSIVAISSEEDACAAVDTVADRGRHGIKITLNAAMPLLPDAHLHALVGAAHRAGMRALVHAEGTGQTERAVAAGADVLVHAPWTNRIGDDVLHRAADAGMTWISTFSIHEGLALDTALDNARRFLALGGVIRYGTDMGNGDLPVGINVREIRLLGEAGLTGAALHAAVFGASPRNRAELRHTDPLPHTADELATWLASATRQPKP